MGLTGADPPQNHAASAAHTMTKTAPKKGARGGRGTLGAPAAKKRAKNRAPELTEEEWAEILNALDSPIPPVQEVADGTVRLPELVRPNRPKASASEWCICPACYGIRKRVSPDKLSTTRTTLMWKKFHKAWWEGVTPEFEALAATQGWKIPGWLREHVPMDVPAPDL